jgi:hypothetical protein
MNAETSPNRASGWEAELTSEETQAVLRASSLNAWEVPCPRSKFKDL